MLQLQRESPAVFACQTAIKESIAMLPVTRYTKSQDSSREERKDHYLHKLLHDQPNPWMDSFEFFESNANTSTRKWRCLRLHCIERTNQWNHKFTRNVLQSDKMISSDEQRISHLMRLQYIYREGAKQPPIYARRNLSLQTTHKRRT
jgi:hypothetical protein